MNQNTRKYRVARLRNNFIKPDEHQPNSSLHSSDVRSPGKQSRKRKNSYNRYNHEKISNSRTTFNSSLKNFSSKGPSEDNIVQFNDVKWLSIISIYDPKKLKHVTASYESYGKFLQKSDVRKDQVGKNQFKGVLDNFKKWAMKIGKGYTNILNIFLYPPLNASPIQTFAKVSPMLNKIKGEASQMHGKVRYCMEVQAYRQFLDLLYKFDTFLQASKDIEEIICIVNQSKNNIDDLFKEIEKDKHLDKKVEKERKRGIEKVRKAVRDYKDDQAEAKILHKVEDAINEMVDKTLRAYSKIKGAKAMLERLRKIFLEKRNVQEYELSDITTVNKIFQEVLNEASEFEKFAEVFFSQTNYIVNDDLRDCIERYLEEVRLKRQTVFEMELQFILKIIESTIEILTANYSICNGVDTDSDCFESYRKIDHLLKEICDCICDTAKKAVIEEMMSNTKGLFRNLREIGSRVRKFDGNVEIDTEVGLAKLRKLQKQTKDYKKIIRSIVEKQEKVYKSLRKEAHRVKRESFPSEQNDMQLQFLQEIIKLSEELNNLSQMQQLNTCSVHAQFDSSLPFVKLAEGLKHIKIIKWGSNSYKKFKELKNRNEVSTILTNLCLDNYLLTLCPMMIKLYSIYNERQSNFLIQLRKISSEFSKSKEKQFPEIKRAYERSLAFIIHRGMKQSLLEIIQNPDILKFPEAQHDVKTLKSNIDYFSKVNQQIADTIAFKRIEHSREVMKQIIGGAVISEELKWNKQNKFYLCSSDLCRVVDGIFENTFIEKVETSLGEVTEKLKVCFENLKNLYNQEMHANHHEIRKKKLAQLIRSYQKINQNLFEGIKKLPYHDNLTLYSQIVFHFTNYIHETKQSAYLVLNPNQQVLWFCKNETVSSGHSGIGKKMRAEHMSKGKQVKSYNNKKNALVRINSKEEEVQEIKEKKVQKKEKIVEQPNQEIMEDKIGDDIADDIEDDMADDIADNIADDIADEEMGEQVMEEDSNIGQEILDDEEMKDEVSQEKKSEQKSTKKQKVEQKEEKKEETKRQKSEEVEDVLIKEKKAQYFYEQIVIQTVQQLKDVIKALLNLQTMYWVDCDFLSVENYSNSKNADPSQLQARLKKDLQRLCQKNFRQELIPVVKGSNNYKQIKNKIASLIKKNKKDLAHILTMIGKKHAKLINGEEVLWVTIERQRWKSISCIEGYIQYVKTEVQELKEEEMGEFNISEYARQLRKEKKGLETIYQVENQSLCPDKQKLEKQLQRIKGIKKEYEWERQRNKIKLAKYPDELDIKSFILLLWQKTLTQTDLEIEIPRKITEDIRELKKISKAENFMNHFHLYKKECENFEKALYEHYLKIQSIGLSTDKTNILQNIQKLLEIYECSPIISWNKKTVLVDEQKFILSAQKTELTKFIEEIFMNINTTSIYSMIKRDWDIFCKYKHQIILLLNIVQIELHIWVSKKDRIVCESRRQILQELVKEATNEIVSELNEFDEEGMEQLKQHLTQCTRQHNDFVYEYKVSSQSALSPLNNTQFRETFLNTIEQYKNRYDGETNLPENFIKSVIDEVLDLEIENQTIVNFVEKLQKLQQNQIFTSTNYSHLYSYHKTTFNKINKTKERLDEELKLLGDIIDKTEILGISNRWSIGKQLHSKYENIIKWLKIYEKIDFRKELKVLKVCQCEDQFCEGQNAFIFYLSLSKISISEELFSHITTNADDLSQYLQKFVEDETQNQYKESKILHLGPLFPYLSKKINPKMEEPFLKLLNNFNKNHFVEKNEELVNKTKKELIQLIEERAIGLKLVKNIEQKLGKQSTIMKILRSYFQINQEEQIEEQIEGKEEEVRMLKSEEITDEEYSYKKFSKFFTSLFCKIYNFEIFILKNKHEAQEKGENVCLLPQKEEKQMKAFLSELNLPSQYQIQDIIFLTLKEQSYKAKIKVNLSKTQWETFENNDYGLEHDEKSRQTYVLGVYKEQLEEGSFEEKIIQIYRLSYEELIANQFSIPIYINHLSVKHNLIFYLLQVESKNSSFSKKQFKKVTNQIVVTEKFNDVFLNNKIELVKIGQFLQKQYEKLLKDDNDDVISESDKVQKNDEKQIDKYLNILYEKLAEADVQTLPKQCFILEERTEKELKSRKNKSIKEKTLEIINQSEKEIPPEEVEEYKNIGNYYVNSLQKLLITREELIEQLIERAKQAKKNNIPMEERESEEVLEQLIKQFQQNKQYEEEIKRYLQEEIGKLDRRERDIVLMGYQRKR